MEAADLIRLAWEAEHDGRTRLRDAVLTLAIAESSPEEPWVERCRARLVLDRPEHFFGQFATLGEAMQDPRVIEARDRLRVKYPASRVQSMLLRSRASRGPYLGRVESIEAMIEDLAGAGPEVETGVESDHLRRHVAQASRGPTSLRWRAARSLVLSYPAMASGLDAPVPRPRQATFPEWGQVVEEPPVEDVTLYYLTVLLAIAFLLATVQDDQTRPA